jgi:hypothetical protein
VDNLIFIQKIITLNTKFEVSQPPAQPVDGMCTHFCKLRFYRMTHKLLTTCPQLYQTEFGAMPMTDNEHGKCAIHTPDGTKCINASLILQAVGVTSAGDQGCRLPQ